jgi:hypothetical protein
MAHNPNDFISTQQNGAFYPFVSRDFFIDKEFFQLLSSVHAHGPKSVSLPVVPHNHGKAYHIFIKKPGVLSSTTIIGQGFGAHFSKFYMRADLFDEDSFGFWDVVFENKRFGTVGSRVEIA